MTWAKNSRAKKIYEAGVEALPQPELPGDPEHSLLRCIAVMLAEATKPKTAVKKKLNLKVNPQDAFEIIKASGAVICEPIDNRWFGRLGKELKALDLDSEGVQRIADYLRAGGWVGSKPTFGGLLRHFSNVASRAAFGDDTTGKVLKHV